MLQVALMSGTLRERGRSWHARIKVKDPVTGAWRELSATRPTKAEAESWLAKALIDAGESAAAGSSATVNTLLDAWQEVGAASWSPSTIKETRGMIDRYLAPRIGHVQLRKLGKADIDRLYATVRNEGGRPNPATGEPRPLAASTVRRVHVILRSALETAVDWEWIARNPAERAVLPRGPKRQIKPPTTDEVVRLIEAAYERDWPGFGQYLDLAATVGARRGEIVALRWRDVTLDPGDPADGAPPTGSVHIEASIARGEDGDVEKETKTGAIRDVTLAPATVLLLTDWRRQCRERSLAVGDPIDGDRFVFSLDPAGRTPMRVELPTQRWMRHRKKLGLEHVRLHDLRHYHATHLLAAGIDLASVAGRMGHANGAATTQAIYAHFLQSSDERAAEVMDRLLRRQQAGLPSNG